MRITGTRTLLALVLCLLLLSAAGGTLAQEPLDPEPVEVTDPGAELSGAELSATVSLLLPYQGRLTVPSTGQPVVDGDYTMTFTLYNADEGGTALWTETKTVSVAGGLFATNLGDGTTLSQGTFNGQALWLGIKVGADGEAAPRIPILPVAYAFSVVPGATVSGSTSSPGLSVTNTGSGHGLYGNSSNSIGVYGASNTSRGVYGVSSESYGVYGASKGALAAVYGANTGTGYSGHFYKPGGVAVYADGSVIVTENLQVNGTVSGANTSLPIAYGYINNDGTKMSGSANVSSTWDSGYERYNITISGESYYYSDYVTIVTPSTVCSNGYTPMTTSAGGKLLVYFKNASDQKAQCQFQFVTYKP
jgi:hypothetical protein